MKKLLLLLSAVGMIFTACEGGEGVEEENGGTPFVPEITISPKDLTFGCNGGEQVVDITANFEYEVTERASWIAVEQTDEGLLVVVEANKNTSERSAFISITNSQYDINKTVEVWQEGYVPKIELAQQSIEVEFEPAEYEVAVTSPYSWEATSKNDWIIVDTPNGIAGTKMLKFSVVRNEEEDIREGTIVVKNDDYNLIAELYVTQKVFVPEWSVSPESLAFTFEGGTQEVAVTANFEEYEASANADWLTIEKSEKGVNITATTNAKFEERTAEITISSEKYGVSKTIAVTQKGVSAESQNVIIYTSSDGKIVTPYKSDVFGANIVSNTYGNGQGAIIFDAPVTSIGDNAFRDCTSLTSVTITDSVTSIGEYAFYYCTSLTSVTIPDRVTSIGSTAFYKCTSLTRVDITDLSAWCKISFGDYSANPLYYAGKLYLNGSELTDITIPSDITEIKNCAFSHCTSLTSVTIGNSVTSIGDAAFYGCTSLTSVTIPESVTAIGEFTFDSCTSLTSITIPDSVTEIGDSAFYECTSLTRVTIGDSVTEIGNWAFYRCSSLTSVTIGTIVTSIGDYAFCYCTSLTSVTIPDSVTSIGEYAFEGCTSLTSIAIPDSVTTIGDGAFWDCTGELIVNSNCLGLFGGKFTKLTIGDSVTSIGSYAFYDCSSLASVTIGNSVTSIGTSAFWDCTSLTSVYCKPTTPPTGGSYMFYNTASGRKIYVPRNSVNAYKSAKYWSSYASDIEGYDF